VSAGGEGAVFFAAGRLNHMHSTGVNRAVRYGEISNEKIISPR